MLQQIQEFMIVRGRSLNKLSLRGTAHCRSRKPELQEKET